MKRAISILAFPGSEIEDVAPILESVGISGLEVAPTAVWSDAPQIPSKAVQEYAKQWGDHGIRVSGIQSLLFGRPDLQVFARDSWPALLNHLRANILVAKEIGASVAVFGSPKNRIRGQISISEANKICAELLSQLVPVLAECEVRLTLEPNAPAYGADYLIDYSEVLALVDLIDSEWVKPQIDTGCLLMVGQNPAAAAYSRTPAHVHISSPHLEPPPAEVDSAIFKTLQETLASASYEGWIVLEMLNSGPVAGYPMNTLRKTCEWLTGAFP